MSENINALTEDERLVYDTLIDAGLCFHTCDENHDEDRCHPAAMDMARAVVANCRRWPSDFTSQQDSAEVLAEYGVGPLAEESS